MSDIKRYDFDLEKPWEYALCLGEEDRGQWVKYADHLSDRKVFEDRLEGNNEAVEIWQKKYFKWYDKAGEKDIIIAEQDILIKEIILRMEHKDDCMYWVEDNINECDCGFVELKAKGKKKL